MSHAPRRLNAGIRLIMSFALLDLVCHRSTADTPKSAKVETARNAEPESLGKSPDRPKKKPESPKTKSNSTRQPDGSHDDAPAKSPQSPKAGVGNPAVATDIAEKPKANVAEAAPRIEHAPLIRGIDPAIGAPGQRIRLTGEHLGHAKKVLFAVGHVSHEADFVVVSDTELEVTAPEFYRVEPNFEASIAVVNSGGVVVTCPATADVIRDSVRFKKSNFLHVMDGGDVEDARTVTVVEDGGIVTRVYGAAWVFVRSRGTLGKASYAGTVFYEPGARLGPSITKPGKNDWDRTVVAAIPVTDIEVAEGIGPFTYKPAASPASQRISEEPPKITQLKPSRVTPGSIVTVTGRGLSGTKDIWIAGGYGPPQPTGFHVVSDELLKLEVPSQNQNEHCKFCVILATPRGTTIAASQEIIMHPGGPVPMPKNAPHQNFGPVLWVRDGELATPTSGAGIVFIEHGGSILDGNATATFVKKGGALTTSHTTWLFSETGARIPENFPKKLTHHADELTLSVIKEPMDLYPQ